MVVGVPHCETIRVQYECPSCFQIIPIRYHGRPELDDAPDPKKIKIGPKGSGHRS